MQGPYREITPGGKVNPRAMRRNSESLGGLYALDAPDGHAFHQGGTGTSLVDQRPKRHLAIIQDTFGSGSGAHGSGPGNTRTGRQVAADMLSAYDAKFAQILVENDTYVTREMPSQPSVLAIEINGVTDVPAGAIVELLPGPGQPDVYYFWWTGESASGSGNHIPVYCNGELSGHITIDGNSVSVTYT